MERWRTTGLLLLEPPISQLEVFASELSVRYPTQKVPKGIGAGGSNG